MMPAEAPAAVAPQGVREPSSDGGILSNVDRRVAVAASGLKAALMAHHEVLAEIWPPLYGASKVTGATLAKEGRKLYTQR
jgi:hypothetical protein